MKTCHNQPFKDGRLSGVNGKARRIPVKLSVADAAEWRRGYDTGRATYRAPISADTEAA